jgi:nicotinate-nucleotide adenylyltransferase
VGGAALGRPVTASSGAGDGDVGAGVGLGVMGGTFDPIHLGHLAVAEEARESLGLRCVLFVPAGAPPHKPATDVGAVEHRVAMVEAAIADNPAFLLSRIEVDRPGPSWTVDTLAMLAERERAAGREPEITLILSAETFGGLPSWHEPRRLFELARVAVVPRAGHDAPDDAWLDRHFPGVASRVVRLGGPRLQLSSTAIRDRVAAGRSIRYLVPDAVARYIGDHGLYQRRPSRNQQQELRA